MIFTETKLKGSYIIDIEPIEDERGFFARTWCHKEFDKVNLNFNIVQCNTSNNKKKGTIRGMHYQVSPFEEAKLVQCTRGAIYDVIIDLRPNSNTFLNWIAVELTHKNKRMLYIPEGFAHGFQTLEDDSDVFYQMGELYHPECARGIKWNDKKFNIEWPITDGITISNKDNNYLEYC